MKYVYKIVAAVGALAIAPLTYFLPLFYYNVQSTAEQILVLLGKFFQLGSASELLSQYGDKIPDHIADSVSFHYLISSYKDFFTNADGSTASVFDGMWELLKVPVIVAALILVLLVVAAIVTAVFAIFSKDNRKVYYSCLAGIGLSVMFKYAFSGITAPFLSGDVTLASLIDAWWVSFVVNIENISLTTSFYLLPAAFVCIMVWTALYNLTLPAEERQKQLAMRAGKAEKAEKAEKGKMA